METHLLEWFNTLGIFAIALSILLNIIISVLGVLPSVVITAVNITFFGFEKGLAVSIAGEALGAIVSFYLYRKGIKKLFHHKEINNGLLTRLQNSQAVEAFCLIIAFRIFPFIPSGLVTLAAAISKVGIINYSIASTIGKMPALVIEAYSIQQVLVWNWKGKVLLSVCLVFFIWLIFNRRKPDVKE
ncbi:TVP38/TMEM64 family protein [Bacillus sp. NTK074B]|uniref:TVP38/TMEM64 family protein n=1 Tax=Bacillus sp. NTK074B TaxID=2802174 RepID=UPI001A8F2A89|nr:TVP38/TMEM64 family protein [Bacillus sp. NTK074B]